MNKFVLLLALIAVPVIAWAQTQWSRVDEQSRLINLGMTPELSSELTGWIAVGGTGFSLVTGTNVACNTTCGTKACIVGQETASKALLACADATADVCLCVGK